MKNQWGVNAAYSEGGLDENQIGTVVILKTLGCMFEFVGFDSAFTSDAEIATPQKDQAIKITENLTDEHHENVVRQVWLLRKQPERMPPQLTFRLSQWLAANICLISLGRGPETGASRGHWSRA
ncbi:hypothetical protein [Rhizobium leguminosarum]|uniref:hypothetical protein n=1 Tax=Rhizobium leguminosarum TaxID=384 RepID=UPI001441B2D6|nr:hypothetical protein [Rhizobium leguminosarum]MBY5869233.1 hypothetical protein [Rhizobium leguminosarum]